MVWQCGRQLKSWIEPGSLQIGTASDQDRLRNPGHYRSATVPVGRSWVAFEPLVHVKNRFFSFF